MPGVLTEDVDLGERAYVTALMDERGYIYTVSSPVCVAKIHAYGLQTLIYLKSQLIASDIRVDTRDKV